MGAWGPVRRLTGQSAPCGELAQALLGSVGALAAILGATLCVGFWLLDRDGAFLLSVVVAGAGMLVTVFALRRLRAGGP
jgi:uncharacterized membrane protein YeaQ/YmgE (transglycosylase-associated protein family)